MVIWYSPTKADRKLVLRAALRAACKLVRSGALAAFLKFSTCRPCVSGEAGAQDLRVQRAQSAATSELGTQGLGHVSMAAKAHGHAHNTCCSQELLVCTSQSRGSSEVGARTLLTLLQPSSEHDRICTQSSQISYLPHTELD